MARHAVFASPEDQALVRARGLEGSRPNPTNRGLAPAAAPSSPGQPESTGGVSTAGSSKAQISPVSAKAQRRANAAVALAQKLKALDTAYIQEPWPRDWSDLTKADCSKFVQWVLEDSNQGTLFGREKANTRDMLNEIERIEGRLQLRRTNPRIGDLMFWGAHVAIVSNVTSTHLQVSQMGLGNRNVQKGNPNTYPNIALPPSKAFDLSVDGPKKLGDGGFLGFWTPPE
jgi:cell wall-associated NlpC family hydrolase